jgi:DegV family protein with EDD domain
VSQAISSSENIPPQGNIAIVTDSVAQVPLEKAREMSISVVPFTVVIEEKAYQDGVDITPEKLYRRMRLEDICPHTSHPSLGEYLQVFRSCLQAGARGILYLATSSRLSGAYSTGTKAVAIMREEHPGLEIEVFDTRTATIAQGFVAMEAAALAARGASMEELLCLVQQTLPKVGFIVIMDTLKYLVRGGRIGKAAYLVGSMIDIKPLLTVDGEGVVAAVARERGMKKAMLKLVQIVERRVRGKRPLRLALMNADAPQGMAELSALVTSRLRPDELIETDFTPVMGAHAGPGLVGLAFHCG